MSIPTAPHYDSRDAERSHVRWTAVIWVWLARVQYRVWHRGDCDRHRRIPHGLAVARGRGPQLREAQRRSRHLARVALPLADSDLLVRPALGASVLPAPRADARAGDHRRLAASLTRYDLVRLPHCPGSDTSRRKKASGPGQNGTLLKITAWRSRPARFDAAASSLNYERTPYYPSAEPDIKQQRLSSPDCLSEAI